jgi:hypothetical protein
VINLTPVILIIRRDSFDDPAWLFDLKFDRFRGVADTIALKAVGPCSTICGSGVAFRFYVPFDLMVADRSAAPAEPCWPRSYAWDAAVGDCREHRAKEGQLASDL